MTDETRMTYSWEGPGTDFAPEAAVEDIDRAELTFLEEMQEMRPGAELAAETYLSLEVGGIIKMREQYFYDRWREVFAAIGDAGGAWCLLRAKTTVYEQDR